ncbi:MAG: prephenate dehydratase [Nitrososphaeraceae archaeon]
MVVHKVAFQGEKGAYSELAVIQFFPNSTPIPARSFQEVIETLLSGLSDYAVVPIENSIEGSVNEVYDLLLQSDLFVIGETYQRIHHCLIAIKGTDRGSLKEVYSHPQALAQCRHYLNEKKLDPVPVYDTAGAVKMIKLGQNKSAAAIGSKRAAEIYGMEILDVGIEDSKNNFTRFYILSRDPTDTKPSGNDGTSIIFSVKHAPGSLVNILSEFARREINLTKIESRPTKKTPWEYNFFTDFEGHVLDARIRDVLRVIEPKTAFVKILGSYKKEMAG